MSYDLSKNQEMLIRQCQRKVQMSKKHADGIAKRAKMRAYCCPVCGQWHVTKLSERQFLEGLK